MKKLKRESGVLLHLSSLPGKYGIGDLGEEAYRFIDFMAESGQSLWEILPLNPVGYGNCPYSSPSAFAVNPLLISPEKLLADGLLTSSDLVGIKKFLPDRVAFSLVVPFKKKLLRRAWENYRSYPAGEMRMEFQQFCRRHAYWLKDYALFVSLKEVLQDKPWYRWPAALISRRPAALREWREKLADRIDEVSFGQYLFFRQWRQLKSYVNRRGIRIIGDLPIYVNYDSVDAWAHREYFYLDKKGRRIALAGVPPAGNFNVSQIWGNPLYHWEKMARDGFPWWTRRFAAMLELADIVRIDHFTGFQASWHIPPEAKTSAAGRWVKGPGAELFRKVEKKLGRFPVIAEDLGPIQDEVNRLLAATGFPGIRVIQFAFDDGEDDMHIPDNYPINSVAYSGTHDTDTIVGWFDSLKGEKRSWVKRYLKLRPRDEVNWKIIECILRTDSHLAIIPLQDLLGIGSEGRMNSPGTTGGQWEWRYRRGTLTPAVTAQLSELTAASGRREKKQSRRNIRDLRASSFSSPSSRLNP